ncbi:Hypothetical predicted protein [Paramuricea clavata]|uniref:Bacteriophage T5 Orf172 DNA-binding domain-containing protein n=1 Tax=Paramuricea clavata TaxID=317549 RepID=A0A7D9I430_PARCT|nr:Hypothetical predicted protein [Paramuricea clavata]CAB4010852.1 Hypothetical predicted protein [Paramuricea clavata]
MPRSRHTNINQIGGGAGRWNGEGRVYLMRQKARRKGNYKIGCSDDPTKRLREIQKTERNKNIKLLRSVKANKMRDAETAAQEAVKKLGLKKDSSRGRATDWFEGSSRHSQEEIETVIRNAVYRNNRQNK